MPTQSKPALCQPSSSLPLCFVCFLFIFVLSVCVCVTFSRVEWESDDSYNLRSLHTGVIRTERQQRNLAAIRQKTNMITIGLRHNDGNISICLSWFWPFLGIISRDMLLLFIALWGQRHNGIYSTAETRLDPKCSFSFQSNYLVVRCEWILSSRRRILETQQSS